MKNDLIEARLRRDQTVLAFLETRKSDYTDIEADVAPLRQDLAAHLQQSATLIDKVLMAEAEAGTGRKKGARNELTSLLKRLILGLRAEATASRDTRLLALAGQPGHLTKLTESSYVEEARRLLSLVPERSAALAKRRFGPAHYTQAQTLLQQFRATITDGRLTDNAASTGRQALERIIKDDNRTVETIRTFMVLYQQDEPDLWNAFQAAARVVRRGGHDGPATSTDGAAPSPPPTA